MHTNIKTFEDACKAIGVIPDSVPNLEALPEPHRISMTAHYKLRIIAQALNEGWEPDWKNRNEYKWEPWWNMSGSGLSFGGADCWDSLTAVGSRLCYKSRAICEYAAQQFIDLYTDYLTK